MFSFWYASVAHRGYTRRRNHLQSNKHLNNPLFTLNTVVEGLSFLPVKGLLHFTLADFPLHLPAAVLALEGAVGLHLGHGIPADQAIKRSRTRYDLQARWLIWTFISHHMRVPDRRPLIRMDRDTERV